MELQEFLTDPVFRSNIIDSLKEIQKQKNDIIKDSAEKHGLNKIDIKLNRTPYDYLKERDMLGIDFLLGVCSNIINKRSTLPAS